MKEFIKSAYETVLGSNFVDVTFFDPSLREPKEVTRKNLLLAETFFNRTMATPPYPDAETKLLERISLLQETSSELTSKLSALTAEQIEYQQDLEKLFAYANESIALREAEVATIRSGITEDLSKIGAQSSQLFVKTKLSLETFKERFFEETTSHVEPSSTGLETATHQSPSFFRGTSSGTTAKAAPPTIPVTRPGGAARTTVAQPHLPEFSLPAARGTGSETAPIPAPPQVASGVADSRAGHSSSGPGAAAYQPPKFLGSTLDRMATKAENLAPPPAAARRSQFPLPKILTAADLGIGRHPKKAAEGEVMPRETVKRQPAEPARRVIGFDPPPPAATANTSLTPVAPVVAATPAAAPPPMEIEEPVAAAHKNSLEEPLLGAPPPKETTSTSHNKVANKGNCCAIL